MELRVLRYFLTVAREETISGAAESLHVTQPTLSRQLMELEEQLGKKLFIRGSRRVTLTDERAVADGDAALVLETAAAVDKNIFPHGNVLAAVGIKGRKQAKGSVHRLAGQF